MSFADSASARTLMLAAKTLKERGGTLILARPQHAVTRVLTLMGADQFIMVQGEIPRDQGVQEGPEPDSA